MNKYKLDCIYDSRKSFYGKAVVEKIEEFGTVRYNLYSYGTLVAYIMNDLDKMQRISTYLGKYSQTTTRHQREFFKQFAGLSNKDLIELFDNGQLVKEIM